MYAVTFIGCVRCYNCVVRGKYAWHEIIVNECIAQGIDYEEMYKIIRELLIRFNAGKAFAKRMGIKWLNNMSKKFHTEPNFCRWLQNHGNIQRGK